MKTTTFFLLNIALALPPCWAQTTSSGAKTLERIGVEIDLKVLTPVRQTNATGRLTPDKYVETQRRIFHHWRERGFDVTGEGIFWAHPPGEGFTGLQAMSWWYPSDPGYQMQIPECLMARGRTDRGGDGDFRFGSSMHGEEIWQKDKTNMPGFLGMFCRTTLPWYYLSRLERKKFENGALYYSDGVVARVEGGERIIRKGEFVLREDDHLFVPALWNKKEIIAYSGPGYANKSWQLPDDWRDVKSVDLYRITMEGCVPLKKRVPVTDAKLVLSLGKDEAVSIVPAGARLSGFLTPDASRKWAMGPFVKLDKPVLSPNPEAKFQCPILGKEVRWEEQNVYNPAAVVRDGKVYLLYRADDKNPDLKWGRTCRIGLASSEDGINFTRHPTPVLYPDNDPWKKYEWEGGCEDLHIVEGEDGTYYMNYTTWSGSGDTMSVATSRDLIHWTKHGPAFRKGTPENVGGRSGVVISRLVGDRLIAAKINGKYWMYYTHPCALVWSDNLIDWTRADKSVWGGGHEAGAIALLRDKDIVLMFNTMGYCNGWTLGQALIDRNDLTTVLQYPNKPFLYPELEWEKKGFTDPAVVANTLVPFKGRWCLYYGGADRYIGLAVFTPKANASFSLVK